MAAGLLVAAPCPGEGRAGDGTGLRRRGARLRPRRVGGLRRPEIPMRRPPIRHASSHRPRHPRGFRTGRLGPIGGQHRLLASAGRSRESVLPNRVACRQVPCAATGRVDLLRSRRAQIRIPATDPRPSIGDRQCNPDRPRSPAWGRGLVVGGTGVGSPPAHGPCARSRPTRWPAVPLGRLPVRSSGSRVLAEPGPARRRNHPTQARWESNGPGTAPHVTSPSCVPGRHLCGRPRCGPRPQMAFRPDRSPGVRRRVGPGGCARRTTSPRTGSPRVVCRPAYRRWLSMRCSLGSTLPNRDRLQAEWATLGSTIPSSTDVSTTARMVSCTGRIVAPSTSFAFLQSLTVFETTVIGSPRRVTVAGLPST